jgi:hypothetical protein
MMRKTLRGLVFLFFLAGCDTASLPFRKSATDSAGEKKPSDEVEAEASESSEANEYVGEVEVHVIDDMDSGKESFAYKLRDDETGDVIDLEFPDKVPDFVAEKKRARILGRPLESDGNKKLKVLDGEGETSLNLVEDFAITGAPLTRSVAVVLVELQDALPLYTPTAAADAVYNKAHAFFQQATFGQVGIMRDFNKDGKDDVFGPYKISATSAQSCSSYYNTWANEAYQMAQNSGVSFTGFDHVMFILPNLSSCSWAGVGILGSFSSGTQLRTWIRSDSPSPRVIAHELGHNLGLGHASTDPDNNGAVDGEYNDQSCMMGLYLRNINGPHMMQMQTFANVVDAVKTVTPGQYALTPLFAPIAQAGSRVLRIPKPNTASYYYFSYRDDAVIGSTYKTGVSIHTYAGGYKNSMYVKTLLDGEVYADPANGVQIAQIGKQADGTLLFRIDQGCTGAQPSIVFNPSMLGASPGSTQSVSATITNNDSSLCASSAFQLTTASSTGITATLSSTQVTIAPKASAVVTLTVQNPVEQGTVTLTATAPNHPTAQKVLNIVGDTVDPTAPTGLAATSDRNGNVFLDWNASTDSGSGIAYYNVYRNGVLLGKTTSLSFRDSGVSGTPSYNVTAVDQAANESAMSNTAVVTIRRKGRK